MSGLHKRRDLYPQYEYRTVIKPINPQLDPTTQKINQ